MSRSADDKRSANQVRAELREAILRGTFVPRQRLIESELAEQFAASRFVIRTVLQQLSSEALVETQPNRGARVREISLDEALEITEIRRAVEGLVAARAAQRANAGQIAELREMGGQMREAVSSLELLRYSELNFMLHSRLRDIGAHETSNKILSQLNGQMVRHQFTLSLVPGRPHVSLPQHLDIIAAVCDRDPDSAEHAMRTHIGSVLGALQGFDSFAAGGLTIPLPRPRAPREA